MKKIIKTILIIIGILIFLSMIGNSMDNTENNNEIKAQTQTVGINQVGIISHKKSGAQIEAIIKNNTTEELNYVRVIAECYDKDGNNLGEFSGMQTNINNKDTYKIDFYCDYDTVKYNIRLEYR